jgi:hypothetical protein
MNDLESRLNSLAAWQYLNIATFGGVVLIIVLLLIWHALPPEAKATAYGNADLTERAAAWRELPADVRRLAQGSARRLTGSLRRAFFTWGKRHGRI